LSDLQRVKGAIKLLRVPASAGDETSLHNPVNAEAWVPAVVKPNALLLQTVGLSLLLALHFPTLITLWTLVLSHVNVPGRLACLDAAATSAHPTLHVSPPYRP
jgi:hypothetical protein